MNTNKTKMSKEDFDKIFWVGFLFGVITLGGLILSITTN